jgi:hypothetical protein
MYTLAKIEKGAAFRAAPSILLRSYHSTFAGWRKPLFLPKTEDFFHRNAENFGNVHRKPQRRIVPSIFKVDDRLTANTHALGKLFLTDVKRNQAAWE